MMIDDTPDGTWHRIPGAYWAFDESGNTNVAELSDTVKKWMSMTHDGMNLLIEMNDSTKAALLTILPST